jgi:hypothetical protein
LDWIKETCKAICVCYVECSHIFPPKFAAWESLKCVISKTGELHWVKMNYLVHSLQMAS